MSYIPKLNDYVKWKKNVEGWVYFKDSSYITIEVRVIPKEEQSYKDCGLHRNDRVLVICYPEDWHELSYVKSRKTKTSTKYFTSDLSTYKSQKDRDSDLY